ncbi:hypothetical protein C8R47DRAFT_1078519 [Mycena vitilis]|nr:hypothetical protein C8R47DRAFT_1078519 [Mycena vitilis]
MTKLCGPTSDNSGQRNECPPSAPRGCFGRIDSVDQRPTNGVWIFSYSAHRISARRMAAGNREGQRVRIATGGSHSIWWTRALGGTRSRSQYKGLRYSRALASSHLESARHSEGFARQEGRTLYACTLFVRVYGTVASGIVSQAFSTFANQDVDNKLSEPHNRSEAQGFGDNEAALVPRMRIGRQREENIQSASLEITGRRGLGGFSLYWIRTMSHRRSEIFRLLQM